LQTLARGLAIELAEEHRRSLRAGAPEPESGCGRVAFVVHVSGGMSKETGKAGRALGRLESALEAQVGGPARLRIIVLLAAVLGLDTADKGTVSAVAGSLEAAFGIGNTEVGLLIAGVSFVGALFTLPMGVIVDRMHRKRLLMVVISLWAVAMVVSGTADSFPYLLGTRVFLGAVTAAATPAVASLTGDFFPARERAQIYGMILAGELVGIGIGFFVSGEVSSLSSWRWSFHVMALPAVVLVWAIWRYLPEPARGGQSWIEPGQRDVTSEEDVARNAAAAARSEPSFVAGNAESSKAQSSMLRSGVEPRDALVLHEDPADRSLWWAIRYLVRIPTYLLIIVASGLGYYFFAGVRGFGMIFLTEHYGIPRSIGSALVFVLGIGALAGVLTGGRISQRLLDRRRFDARIVVPGVALFLAVTFFAPGILTANAFVGVVLLTLGATALAAANPPIDAARLDIVHPRLWGRAESGRMALRAVLEGSAPIVFGLVSTRLGAGAEGLKWTYLVMLVPLLVAASLAIPARRTYPRDVATAAASAKETAKTRR
jgi:predicted MFS family arabinose efflux permease